MDYQKLKRPTEPGEYWLLRAEGWVIAYVNRGRISGEGLYYHTCDYHGGPVSEHAGQWRGPIPRPNKGEK